MFPLAFVVGPTTLAAVGVVAFFAVVVVFTFVVGLVLMTRRRSPAAAPVQAASQSYWRRPFNAHNALADAEREYQKKEERKELLKVVSAQEGVDLEELIAEARSGVGQAAGAVGALLLALVLATSAEAAGPQRWEPTPHVVVRDEPQFFQPQPVKQATQTVYWGSNCNANGCRRLGFFRRR